MILIESSEKIEKQKIFVIMFNKRRNDARLVTTLPLGVIFFSVHSLGDFTVIRNHEGNVNRFYFVENSTGECVFQVDQSNKNLGEIVGLTSDGMCWTRERNFRQREKVSFWRAKGSSLIEKYIFLVLEVEDNLDENLMIKSIRRLYSKS